MKACLEAAEIIYTDVGDRRISSLSPICPAQWKCASTSGNLKDCTGKKIATTPSWPQGQGTLRSCMRSGTSVFPFTSEQISSALYCPAPIVQHTPLGISLNESDSDNPEQEHRVFSSLNHYIFSW